MLALVSLMAGRRSRFMAVNVSWVLVILVLADIVCAQGPAPSPSSGGCDDTVSNLLPCLTYVTGNDTKPPSKDCCSGLIKVVKGNILCLCSLLGSSSSSGFSINQTRAAGLPAACKVKTPPISACGAALTPSPTPSGSTGVGSPTTASNTVTPVSSPSATTGAVGSFRPSPLSVFTALFSAGVVQLLI